MNVLRNMFSRNIPSVLKLQNQLSSMKNYHSMFSRSTINVGLQNNLINYRLPSLLASVPIMYMPICGFKFKGIVRKRCKDCYITVKDRQKILLCKTHRRHKQKEIVPHEKDTWIITHRTQGKIRPW